MLPDIVLRPVADTDLGALFAQMSDPESVRMAAFTPPDPSDRDAFAAHMARVRSSPENVLLAVVYDDVLVGSVASFVMEGETEVTYWIDRAYCGRGIATAALAQLLSLGPVRPVFARAASDNLGSLRVLARCGFAAKASADINCHIDSHCHYCLGGPTEHGRD
jgi:RimJ/RimL family protein N-acetyltransferase